MEESLCILIHCLKKKGQAPTSADGREFDPFNHFIDLDELEGLIKRLLALGYKFILPHQAKKGDKKICSLTFDDGYYNNSWFLPLAEKYQIPFIIFMSSYNVMHQVPFIWDLHEYQHLQAWNAAGGNYLSLYEDLNAEQIRPLMTDFYRPFKIIEIKELVTHPLVFIAPHSHTHRPTVRSYSSDEDLDFEINENLIFFEAFQSFLKEDFSIPCGLYCSNSMKYFEQRFQRIYTIEGGSFKPGDQVISRISLNDPDVRGDLLEQINSSFSFKSRLRRSFIFRPYIQWKASR